jgi:SAM-dependent methyltransferase
VRGWLRLYGTSVGLGLRYLLRRGYLREAVIRVLLPLEPSRYLELPWTRAALGARAGERVLDLASPKLLAFALARQGLDVTSVDLFPSEVESWRKLVGAQPNLRLEVGDGRSLPFDDASFDHAYSVSVLEHIADDGAEAALCELARVVRLGGRVAVTMPYAREAWEEWRDKPVYGEGEAGRAFFQVWYDDGRVERLSAAAPALDLVSREVVRMQPNWNRAYVRTFPWLLPLGPLFGLLALERNGPGGDVVRLVFTVGSGRQSPKEDA